MVIHKKLILLSVAGILLSFLIGAICLRLTHTTTSNFYIVNGVILFVQSSVFLLLSTIWVRFIFNQVTKFYVKLGILIISFLMLMALSLIILCGGSLFLFKASIDDVLVFIFYWGILGVSLSIFFAIPIYLIVIYLIYKDHQKNSGEKSNN